MDLFFFFFSGEGDGSFFVVGEVHHYLNFRDLKLRGFDVACAMQFKYMASQGED